MTAAFQAIIDKTQLVKHIIASLTEALNQAISAANQAHEAAVDDQSVAETQYDTLAIEASYLAEGQSRRVQELQEAILAYQQLICFDFNDDKAITLSALVQLASAQGKNQWFFIGPAAGGLRCQYSQQHITVITPQSPMGQALIDKQSGDDIELAKNNLADYIVTTR